MPPKVVKRGAAAKKAKLSSKPAIQNQQQEPVPEPVKNHDDNHVADVETNNLAQEIVPNGLDVVETDNGEEIKESLDEYEKDEHLDLEDNYHEYDHEEYVDDDYDEGEIEQDEGQEVGDEVEEEPEENVDEEEGDTGDEEVEYIYEEVEGDDDDAVAADDAATADDAAAASNDAAAADVDDEHASEENSHEHLADVEEEEQGEVRKERQKKKEFEVFVGGLDKDATEHDLRKVFGKVGKITEARLMMNPRTKKNTGFALLRFETVEQVKRALAELKHPVINGKQCGITSCQDSDTLYLDNICKTWKKEALKEKLKDFGVESFKDLTLVEDGNNEGRNCGFAFLEFSSRSDAKEAYKRLQKTDFGDDKPSEVSFADSFIDLGDDVMAQVKTVFIDLLPPSWDEDYVRDLLKKYGEVEKVELAKNMPAARRKNYGFVTFATHAAAVECAESITSAGLGEGSKKAKVRARLSRPLQKIHGKHVTHKDFSSQKSGRLARPSRSGPLPQSRPLPRNRPIPQSRPARVVRRFGNHIPPVRPSSVRNRRPVTSMPLRARPVTPPARSYDRRLPAAYPKSSMKRAYDRPVDLPPPRSRVSVDYGSQMSSERRPSSYRDYPARDSGYSDLHTNASHTAPRRGYLDDGYDRRLERPRPPPPHLSYREGRPRDYETLSGSKRPYASIDDISPRYADARQSRSRLDYDYGGSGSQYREAYHDRLGRSSLGYSGSRSSISIQNSHGTYSRRHDTSYGGGSIGGSDGGIYSSSYGRDYVSRESDVGGSSYSSMYSSRGMNGSSSYTGGGGGGSRSYY